jgi:uncharacterized protein YegP (UPF0339 family)
MPVKSGKFKLIVVADGGYSWQLYTDMGQLLCQSNIFPDRESAERTIRWVVENAGDCPIES